MDQLQVIGGVPLRGTVDIQGSTEEALVLLAASLLTEQNNIFYRIPYVTDIDAILVMLIDLGCFVEWTSQALEISVPHILDDISIIRNLPEHFVSAYESRFYCDIPRLRGHIELVDDQLIRTATAIFNAVLGEGMTTLHGASTSPAIVQLQVLLRQMGANIFGAGTSMITIEAVKRLNGCQYTFEGDYDVAKSVMLATAMTRGHVALRGISARRVSSFIKQLSRAGVHVQVHNDIITVRDSSRLRPLRWNDEWPNPYSILLAVTAEGTTYWSKSYSAQDKSLLASLKRMGATIHRDSNGTRIIGVRRLFGAAVEATSAKDALNLLVAACAAQGHSTIYGIDQINSVYDSLLHLFAQLGAQIHSMMDRSIVRCAAVNPAERKEHGVRQQ